jgi:acyl-coenzyme A thioesterase PaaI-like protein
MSEGIGLKSVVEKESLVKDLGIEHAEAEPDRVVMTVPVDERHVQPKVVLPSGRRSTPATSGPRGKGS